MSASLTIERREFLAAAAMALALAVIGCEREPIARVVLAEFQDEIADGEVQQDETIRLLLDRALPVTHDAAKIRLSADELGSADFVISIDDRDRTAIVARVRTGRPAFRFTGVYGVDRDASGLWVDLGDGVRQSVDVQIRRPIAGLIAATWIDGSADDAKRANGVVDQGDRVRLRFDGPVRLAVGTARSAVRVPEHIFLSKEGVDRLDDGSVSSTWEASPRERSEEVDIVLGSRPVLRVDGTAPAVPSAEDREQPAVPSGLAIHGTDVRPMRAIIAGADGPGAASSREIDIAMAPELAAELTRFAGKRRWLQPERGRRSLHSLTPFLGRYALLAGGLDSHAQPQRVLRDLLLLSTSAAADGTIDVGLDDTLPDLPLPVYEHTATLLVGEDRTAGTADDLVLIAGGTDDRGRTVADLAVVFLNPNGRDITVRQLATKLAIPRAEHAAVAVGHDRVLIDGGRSTGRIAGRGGLVGVAELLTIRQSGDKILVDEALTFRSHARKRHTLTHLRGATEDDPWVLAYGGFGPVPKPDSDAAAGERSGRFGESIDPDAPDAFTSESDGAVLYTPSLIRVASPEDSIVKLDLELDAAFLRHGHRAIGLPLEQAGPTTDATIDGASEVAIFGGTLVHPDRGLDGAYYELWEISAAQYLQDLDHQRPGLGATLDGVLFRFDAENPHASRLEVIPHPTLRPETLLPRRQFSLTTVPGFGVLIAGGETSGRAGAPELLSSVEVYFTHGEHRGELRELAWSLQTPRSRHESYLVERQGRRFLLLVGGETPDASSESGTDVEVLPLP